MNNNNNDTLGIILDILSIMLGYENLIENRQQSANNNVAKHNSEQTKKLLDDLHTHFNNQNEILKYQNTLLEEILKILKGDNR